MSTLTEETAISSYKILRSHSVSNTKINELNNDCLRYVFQYLPIVDRIRLERVCKRWQAISFESWQDLKELYCLNEYFGFNRDSSMENLTTRSLKKVLYRCGQYVTYIEFSEFNKRLGPNVLNAIANYCPNIQELYASSLKVSPSTIRNLAKKCHKITCLILGDCTDECDDELALLFKKNKRLKVLHVNSNFEISGKCLSKLNKDCIETIIFENCPFISLKYFEVVRHFTKLKVLMVEHFHDCNNRTIEGITSCSENLKSLTLSLCAFEINSLRQVAKLTNLECLDLSSNVSVDDNVLAAVGANCKHLKNIDISYCTFVTNEGLSKISVLPRLKSLNLENLFNITDDVFRGVNNNLRELDCSYCCNVGDAGLVNLIESSDKLEYLFLRNCKNVSNRLLEAAIKSTKQRRNNIILKIYASNTNIKVSKVNDISPFLQVVPLIVINYLK